MERLFAFSCYFYKKVLVIAVYFLPYFQKISLIDLSLYRGGIFMQEYQCSSCGYRKMERDMIDIMGEIPMYSGFGSSFMPSFSSQMFRQDDMVCPNCKKASSWETIINNSN